LTNYVQHRVMHNKQTWQQVRGDEDNGYH